MHWKVFIYAILIKAFSFGRGNRTAGIWGPQSLPSVFEHSRILSVEVFTLSTLSEHTGKKEKRASVARGLVVKPLLFSSFQSSLTDRYSAISL